MSHGKLREDKTCLNCGHFVEEKFCPNCGQENTERRQPFHYLFTHFIEDFTHYDGQFWKTLKYLLFRPGQLTKEYLAGKRQTFVPPVKLYIFVSFVTFFALSILPNNGENSDNIKVVENQKSDTISDSKNTDLAKELIAKKNEGEAVNFRISEEGATITSKDSKFLGASNLKEYDSLSIVNEDDAMFFLRPIAKKLFELHNQNKTQQEISEVFWSNFLKNLPKALFIYLPIFTFILWLFHNKKKWWFFDHGVFTLHYFSFLLLGILSLHIIMHLYNLFDNFVLDILYFVFVLCLYLYMIAYFYIAHKKVYQTRKRITILTGSVIFLINIILIIFLLIGLFLTSLLMIH